MPLRLSFSYLLLTVLVEMLRSLAIFLKDTRPSFANFSTIWISVSSTILLAVFLMLVVTSILGVSTLYAFFLRGIIDKFSGMFLIPVQTFVLSSETNGSFFIVSLTRSNSSKVSSVATTITMELLPIRQAL